jgi:hypothetical protein
MNYTDPRINEERLAAAAISAQREQNFQNQQLHRQSHNTQSQSLPFGAPANHNQEQSIQMSSTAGPLSDYHTSDYQVNSNPNPQQQAPQHAGYQQYVAAPSQAYMQQLPTQMAPSHFQGHQQDYAHQGFSQQQGHIQVPPQPSYQQPAYNIGGITGTGANIGPGAGVQDSVMQSNAHLATQTSHAQRSGARGLTDRPVIKLSVNLIDTYKRINDAYYERKREAAAVERADRQNEPRGQGVHNHGWDDEHYDYIIRSGEVIGERYKLSERIGKGSFGQVVRAFDITTKKEVAIKIIKSRRPFTLQARTEIDLLTHLKNQDPDDHNNIGKSWKMIVTVVIILVMLGITHHYSHFNIILMCISFPPQYVSFQRLSTKTINVWYLKCFR